LLKQEIYMPTPQQHPAMASHLMPLPQEVNIGLVCQLLLPRSFVIVPASEQIRHEFGLSGKPCGGAAVWCIARRLGLKAIKRSATWAHLGILPLRAIAQYTDGRYVILGQVDGERVLVQNPRMPSPHALALGMLTLSDFEALLDGLRTYLFSHT